MKLVAIDFETADQSADSPCAIGIVSIEKGKITKKGYRLIRHTTADQVSHQRRQAIVLALQPVVLDRHVLALDVADFAKALAERGHIAPRKPTSSWAPADRKALARSRLLNGKDLRRTSAAPRPHVSVRRFSDADARRAPKHPVDIGHDPLRLVEEAVAMLPINRRLRVVDEVVFGSGDVARQVQRNERGLLDTHAIPPITRRGTTPRILACSIALLGADDVEPRRCWCARARVDYFVSAAL
jgi:hypothetical protein